MLFILVSLLFHIIFVLAFFVYVFDRDAVFFNFGLTSVSLACIRSLPWALAHILEVGVSTIVL